MQNDDDDPTGRNPDATQADYTNAPSSAHSCLAARDADFIEASGHLCRTKRPGIWAHRLPKGRIAIPNPGPKGPFHIWYYRQDQPKLREIYYRVIPDAASRGVSLEQGETELAAWQDIEPFDVARPNLEMTTDGYEYFSPLIWIELNCRRAPMNDKRFRQALMHLIDREFVRDRILFGLANAATGPIASSMRFYTSDVKTYEPSVDKAVALRADVIARGRARSAACARRRRLPGS